MIVDGAKAVSRGGAGSRVDFDMLVSTISSRLLKTPCDRLDAEIEESLADVMRFFDGDRCGLLRTTTDQRQMSVTHICYLEGVPLVSSKLNLAEQLPWAYDRFTHQAEPLILPSLDELPPGTEQDRRFAGCIGIRSTIDVPIVTGNRVRHVLSLNATNRLRDWPKRYVSQLRLLGEVFVNALERKRLHDALHERGSASTAPRKPDNGVSRLTQRQCEVLELLARGYSMKCTAHRLGLTPRTVAFHKYRMMERLEVKSTAELIQFAVRHGIVSD